MSDNDWYGRWISDIAEDVADGMQGEEEREARMKALHLRLDQLRRSLKQLRGAQRGRGPRVKAAREAHDGEDARIRTDVINQMAEDWYLDATDIEVVVRNGEVTLTGTVDSRAAKRLAEDCADSIPGVEDVHNALRIRRQA